MFFTFLLLITSGVISIFSSKIYAQDLLEQAFQPAVSNQTIVNLWAGKNAVGNEVLRQWIGVQTNLGWCTVNGQHLSSTDLQTQISAAWYNWWPSNFCQQILGWTNDPVTVTNTAPLIVRITKFLLRITMVLAVTMVIYNGIMYVLESAKWGEVKDAKKNITFIIVWILIALMSLGIINLISSITVSSLNGPPTTSNSSPSNWWNTYYWTH